MKYKNLLIIFSILILPKYVFANTDPSSINNSLRELGKTAKNLGDSFKKMDDDITDMKLKKYAVYTDSVKVKDGKKQIASICLKLGIEKLFCSEINTSASIVEYINSRKGNSLDDETKKELNKAILLDDYYNICQKLSNDEYCKKNVMKCGDFSVNCCGKASIDDVKSFIEGCK